MLRLGLALQLLLISSASFAGAQSDAVSTLRAETKIVVVDVVVTDKQGAPVKGLKAADFALAENGAAQRISHFDAHSSLSAEDAAKVEAMPKLAPNVFTNYSPVAVESSLNVLLLDDLNTKLMSKTVVIQQALKYLSTPHPGARMEIFELGAEGDLKLIQGFTSDAEVLRTALTRRKVAPQVSVTDDPLRRCGIVDYSTDSDGVTGDSQPAMSTGDAECLANQLKVRSISTLQAMAALARYMGRLPGRKNLVWFSSAFAIPVNETAVSNELRRTMELFATHQVAVYPIVAGGVLSPSPIPSYQVGVEPAPAAMKRTQGFFARTDNEQSTMEQIAEGTGGKVFAKSNDLAGLAGKAVDDGSNYYTLMYTPTDREWKGDFRRVEVKLAEKGYRLAYRQGYFAEDAGEADRKDTGVDAANSGAKIALNAAMEYGSPQPADVVLKVAVNPATGLPENTVAKMNVVSPKVSAPFERYVISVAALPQAFTFTRDVPGKVHMAARLVTRVYSADGALINTTTVNAIGDIDDARYQTIMAEGVQFRQEISVPVQGESFLRIGVEDLATSRVGVVEVPVAMVAKLKPLVAEVK